MCDSFDQVEIFEDFLEVQKNVRRKVMEPVARSCGARIPRPSLQRVDPFAWPGVVQPLQEVHPVFLATCEKVLKALSQHDGVSGVDSSAMVTCRSPCCRRVHQIDDLGSWE